MSIISRFIIDKLVTDKSIIDKLIAKFVTLSSAYILIDLYIIS